MSDAGLLTLARKNRKIIFATSQKWRAQRITAAIYIRTNVNTDASRQSLTLTQHSIIEDATDKPIGESRNLKNANKKSMNEMVASTCEEKWQRLLDAEVKFYAARMELFSICREQLVELVRAGLNVPSQRVTALGVAKLLTIEERQLLLVDLLALASYCHGLTVTAREIVLSLPQQWLIYNIEESADPLLPT